jgi:PAS domain S-box-containing protein
MRISSQISEKRREILKLWKIFDNFAQKRFLFPYLMYGVYLDILNNRSGESGIFFKNNIQVIVKNNLHKKGYELNDDSIYLRDTMTINASGNKETLGFINACSESFLKNTGYTENMILGQKINRMMPNFYSEKHDGLMSKYFDSGKSNLLGRTRKVLIQGRKDQLIPILIHVKVNPFYNEGLNFLGVMRPLREIRDYILVRKSGVIDTMGVAIKEKLGITSITNMNISEICRELLPVLDAFNKIAATQVRDKRTASVILQDQHLSNQMIQEQKNIEAMKQFTQLKDEFSHRSGGKSSKRAFDTLADVSTFTEKKKTQIRESGRRESFIGLISELKDSLHMFKKYSEAGSEVKFRSKFDNTLELALTVKLETDYIGSDWIHIVKIDGL